MSDDEFGPEVIFERLLAAGIRFHFVGFITHYAAERCQSRRAAESDEQSRRVSHYDNIDRLARALRALGCGTRSADGHLVPFTGDGTALEGTSQRFETPHGSVHVSVRKPARDEPEPTAAEHVEICITSPLAVLQGQAATGRYPGLPEVVEILELWDTISPESQAPRNARQAAGDTLIIGPSGSFESRMATLPPNATSTQLPSGDAV